MLYVVVDRSTKYAHFLPMTGHYTARSIVQAFFDQIFRLHGLALSVVSDRDKVFTILFLQETFAKLGAQINLSTAYCP